MHIKDDKIFPKTEAPTTNTPTDYVILYINQQNTATLSVELLG